jgi:hypothetical protein
MHAGSGGVTATVGEWGTILQRVHAVYDSHPTTKLSDITLTNIGYQTDNGAYYVFCTRCPGCDGNCSRALINTVMHLREQGVPMGYVSYQGAGVSTMSRSDSSREAHNYRRPSEDATREGVSSDDHNAPWCVNTWSADLPSGHGSYPLSVKELRDGLGVPLQLYAPYFCPGSEYFNGTAPAGRAKPWTPVNSSLDLDGCSFYGFQDVSPGESREFYDWFFAKGIAVGMESFEPDFMNQNYECVPAFVESATASQEWQHGMVDAAFAKTLTVQWCYAAPTDVLASLLMPALTNFRVSNDFCYGESWNVGLSSLIVWAAGSAPSKDTLWTTDNGHFAVPGCDWTPDHETPAAELHVVIALMTTGPVGISDGMNMTNVALITRTIAASGLLLKPSKPITSVDSMLRGYATAPHGNVYTTYSGATASAATAHYFVSFQMQAAWTLTARDFYPALGPNAPLAVRSFHGTPCADGAAAHTCLSLLHAPTRDSTIATLPKSDLSNTTAGTDFAPTVTTVWSLCASGTTLLGELGKYVPLSTNRFTSNTCTSSGCKASMVGTAAGEVVTLTILKHGSIVVEQHRFKESGQVLSLEW